MPRRDQIRVVVMEPGKAPEEKKIVSSLETLQKIVGGYIEGVSCPWNGRLLMYGHDEGKLIGLPANFVLPEYEDIFMGPVVVVGPADDEGYETDLDDEQVKQSLSELTRRKI
jgi:hypothetical protein